MSLTSTPHWVLLAWLAGEYQNCHPLFRLFMHAQVRHARIMVCTVVSKSCAGSCLQMRQFAW